MKNTKYLLLVMLFLGTHTLCSAQESAVPVKFTDVQTITHPRLQMTVMQADLQLPSGSWELINRDKLSGLDHIQFGPVRENQPMMGSRYAQIESEKVQRYINSFYPSIEKYALDNADYDLTLSDFNGDKQGILNLVKNITGELGQGSPSFDSADEALAWLNESITPFQILVKYMEDAQFGYPDYGIINEIKRKYKIKKMDELREPDLRSLVQTVPGKRLKRIILVKRYKLQTLKKHPDSIFGPPSIDNLDEHVRVLFHRQTRDYTSRTQLESKVPHYFLIPHVKLSNKKEDGSKPLVVELHPYIDDGKHWVLFSNRTSKRVDINPDLAKKYNITIEPAIQQKEVTQQSYYLAALVLPEIRGPWEFLFKDSMSGKTVNVPVSLDKARAAESDVFNDWLNRRAYSWIRMYNIAPSTIYFTWLANYKSIYDTKFTGELASANRRMGAGRTTSMFNLLGGRAAIEETLQMINLDVANSKNPSAEEMIPLDQIEGVKVKGHPYEEMLAGQEGGRLPMADYVPHDRFFTYFAQPSDLASYLDNGVGFMHQFGSDFIGNHLNYDLKERYFKRLGLNADWVERFLKSKLVKEVALILPDLFFIDGTDITLILNVPNLSLVSPLLKLVGVADLNAGQIFEKSIDQNRTTYWAANKQILVVSTNKNEITNVLNLIKNGGKGSLGQSAEFRYMLTQMPVIENTKTYSYFSDPFIRRMVGPQVKIAHYRRLKQRSHLEAITAAALLYKSDGHADQPTMEKMAALGYIPEQVLNAGYTLDDNWRAHSDQYGNTSDLNTILDLSVKEVTRHEAKAYKSYVDNYSRYWRQFFDPIAIRYDVNESKESEINVFILPLIDSSIYDGARLVLNGLQTENVLKHPSFSPEPLMTLSANINEKTWVEIVKGLSFLKTYMNLSPDVFDEFGPSLHIIVEDADPVINLGSGDFLGVMGAGGTQLLRGREAFLIPTALMMFTRPVKIMFELKDTNKVLQHLRNVSTLRVSRPRRDWAEPMVEFTQIDDQDEWHCRISLFGLLKLRFGVRIQDNFLVFTNVPWSQQYNISFSESGHLNSAGFSLYPGAAKLQLPGLYNTALEGMGEANRRSMVYLTPLVESNNGDIEKSLIQHKQLFGFTPLHSGKGEWRWKNGELNSTSFGSVWSRRQPTNKVEDRDFGLFREFHKLSVSMQFEDEGLRTKIRWKPHGVNNN